MSEKKLFNFVTLMRNSIFSFIFGILVPIIIFLFHDPRQVTFNFPMLIINGIIFVAGFTVFGLFKQETLARFLVGLGWIGTLVYFYTFGNNFFTGYFPHCGFGQLCINVEFMGRTDEMRYNYIWVCVLVPVLVGLQNLRQLIKPYLKRDQIFRDTFKFSKAFD